MTHPALATMVEAAEKATPVQEGDLMRYAHGGSRLAILRGGERTLVADFYHEGDTEFYALASPANILSLAEYVRGLEEALKEAQRIIDETREDLHQRRIGDWYPEGANEAAKQMSEDMRLIGNGLADVDVTAALGGKP